MKSNLILLMITLCFLNGTLTAQSTKIIAHRGASSLAPENTLAAFSKAAEVGADYFELDVQLSKDDSMIVIHDATVDRTTNGSGTVSALTYAQLRQLDAGSWFGAGFSAEKLPTLRESLLLAKDKNIKVCIEIKASAFALVGKVVGLVEELQMTDEVIIFCFDFSKVSEAKQLNPQIPALHLVSALSASAIDAVANISAEAIGTNSGVTKNLIDYAHQKNVEIWQWTVNNPADMKNLMDLGIDGIITNYPQRLVELMDTTPPSDVILEEAKADQTTIELNWQAAFDEETGIMGYEIYRDSTAGAALLYATVGDTLRFIDRTYKEHSEFYYRVKAVNNAGLSSQNFSNEIHTTTTSDIAQPQITKVVANGDRQKIYLTFNERIDEQTAEDKSNYIMNHSIEIVKSNLALDAKTVILSTSSLDAAVEYELDIKNVLDRALTANVIDDTTVNFRHYDFFPDLIAAWDFDGHSGDTLKDASVNANHCQMINSPGLAAGHLGNAIKFDGKDGYIQLPQSASLNKNFDALSISLWVYLEDLPSELPGSYGPILDSYQDCYIIYEDRGNSELRFKVATSSGAERPGIRENRLHKNEWLHVVGVYDGSEAKIFLNGQLEDVHSLSGKVKSGQRARFGENGGYYFNGKIDNTHIYERALNPDEIEALFSGKRGVTALPGQTPGFPITHKLGQNFPNPFNPRTVIPYSLSKKGRVDLSIYNILGQKLATLVSGEQSPGTYSMQWNASEFASGLYFYKLTTPDKVECKKMLKMN